MQLINTVMRWNLLNHQQQSVNVLLSAYIKSTRRYQLYSWQQTVKAAVFSRNNFALIFPQVM